MSGAPENKMLVTNPAEGFREPPLALRVPTDYQLAALELEDFRLVASERVHTVRLVRL